MASKRVKTALEEVLASVDGDAEQLPDVATYVVGGRKFQVLEQTIRSRGQTMLADLLCDPGRKDKSASIFVEGDSERFRYILDWYRFGSIKIPCTVSLEEMRRECAFYGLPDDVRIDNEGMGVALSAVTTAKKRAREEAARAGVIAAAHAAFDALLHDICLLTNGKATRSWSSCTPPDVKDWKSCLVWHTVLKAFKTSDKSGDYSLFKDTLSFLAQREHFSVDVDVIPVVGATFLTIELVATGDSKPKSRDSAVAKAATALPPPAAMPASVAVPPAVQSLSQQHLQQFQLQQQLLQQQLLQQQQTLLGGGQSA